MENFNRVTFQLYGNAVAEVSLDLSKLFPVPEGATVKLSQSVSSMLEVNIGNTAPSALRSIDVDGVEAEADNMALALTHRNETDRINVWYESLDSSNGFRSNTYVAAKELCTSKGEGISLIKDLVHPRGSRLL